MRRRPEAGRTAAPVLPQSHFWCHRPGRNRTTPPPLPALSGAHTVGFAHCSRFTKRLYNYSSTVKLDPSFNPEYAKRLMEACPPNVGPTIAVNMDPFSPVVFDNIYYQNLRNGIGLFTSDQALFTDGGSRKTVEEFADSEPRFFQAFVESMMKVGRLGVKTGGAGEIRRDCTAFNHKMAGRGSDYNSDVFCYF